MKRTSVAWTLALLSAGCGGLGPGQPPMDVVASDEPARLGSETTTAARGPILMTVRGWQMSRDMSRRGPLAMDDALRSGDFFAYYLRVDRDAYIYVLQFYPDGRAQVLFPEHGDVLIAAAPETRIPRDAQSWFQLDDATGTEHLYVIASIEPLDRAAPAMAALVGDVRASPVGTAEQDGSAGGNVTHGSAAKLGEQPAGASALADDGRPRAAPTTPESHAVPRAVPRTTPLPRSLPRDAVREAMADAQLRAVKLVRIDDGGATAYQGRTDDTGVGIAHFPFRHE